MSWEWSPFNQKWDQRATCPKPIYHTSDWKYQFGGFDLSEISLLLEVWIPGKVVI